MTIADERSEARANKNVCTSSALMQNATWNCRTAWNRRNRATAAITIAAIRSGSAAACFDQQGDDFASINMGVHVFAESRQHLEHCRRRRHGQKTFRAGRMSLAHSSVSRSSKSPPSLGREWVGYIHLTVLLTRRGLCLSRPMPPSRA